MLRTQPRLGEEQSDWPYWQTIEARRVLWAASESILGTVAVLPSDQLESVARSLTADQRQWLADVLYDETLVAEHYSCTGLAQEAGAAVALDPSDRNRRRAAYLREHCAAGPSPTWIIPPCTAAPPGEAYDISWNELTAHPLAFHQRRVRMRAWYTHEFEDAEMWPAAAFRQWFAATSLQPGSYAGDPVSAVACAKHDVLVEGTFDAFAGGGTFSPSVATINDWRVVAAPRMPKRFPAPPRPPLPPSPDPDMVRVAGGDLPAGWRAGEAAPTHVEAFDIDRDEFSARLLRRRMQEGKVRGAVPLAREDPAADSRPLVCVTAMEAAALCRDLGKRLPTEQEWARAALPLASQAHAAEDSIGFCDDRVWLGGPSQAGSQVVADASDVTPTGISGLAGGVEEWTSSPFCRPPPIGCTTFDRVVRGGTAGAESAALRRSGRGGTDTRGFRCAR